MSYNLATPSQLGQIEWREDFMGDVLDADVWTALNTSGSGVTALTPSSNAHGGLLGDTGTADNGRIALYGGPVWDPRNGPVRVDVHALVNRDAAGDLVCAVNFGLIAGTPTDMPAELSGTTWTSNDDTFVGFVFDTDATNDDWHAFWVDDNSDASVPIADLRMRGRHPLDNVDFTLGLQVTIGENEKLFASFFHNGKPVKRFQTNVDSDQSLQLFYGVEARAAAQHNVTLHGFSGCAGRHR